MRSFRTIASWLVLVAAQAPPPASPAVTSTDDNCPVTTLAESTDDGTTCYACSGSGGTPDGKLVPALVVDAQGFPAYGIDGATSTTQMTVHVNVIFMRIDAIDIAAGTWTVRMQVDMYYDAGVCQSNQQLSDLCSNRLGDLFYFGMPQQVQQPLGSTSNGKLSGTGMFAGDYASGSCLNGDFVDATFTLGESFVPLYFPFEAYKLTFRLASFVDNKTVHFEVLERTPNPDVFERDMPDNWNSRNALTCEVVDDCLENSARGGVYCVSEVRCSVVVSATSEGYLLTVLVFWVLTMLANLFGGLGTFAATERDGLRDAILSRGVFSSSFVLAYVFVVPPRPHDLPLAGTMPTSTLLFLLGLVNLVVCTFWSFVVVQVLQVWVRDTSKHVRWWQVFTYAAAIAPVVTNAPVKREPSSLDPTHGEVHGVSEREVRHMHKLALLGRVDLVVWLTVNMVCLISGIIVICTGQSQADAQVNDYINELAASR